LRKDDRGAIVQLPYGLEAFAPIKHIRKEDGSMANVEEILTVKVIEFNRDDKRILVSHLRYLDDIRRDADETVKKDKQEQRTKTRSQVKSTQSKVERTTLGEMDVFSQLRGQIEADNKSAEKEAPAKPEPKAAEPEVAKVEAEVTPKEEVVEEIVVEVEEVEETVTAEVVADDLKKIEGIGPKISEKLQDAGIKTFAQLADAKVEKLKEILEAAGSRYKMHDPTTWPQQSALAAAGKWDELKVLQDELQGGKKA